MRTRWLTFVCTALAVLAVPDLLYALQDSTAVTDKTGLFGPIIDKIFPVFVTFATSLVVKLVALINKGFAKSGELVKWVALYAIAMAFNLGARQLGITEIDPLAPMFGLGLVQTVSAALIFKFGGRSVPALEPSPVP